MATISKRASSYKITVSCGYDQNGKQIRRHQTWTPEPGMTERQIEKALGRETILFEESCRTGQILDGSARLTDFAERWFTDYAEKQLKPKTISTYRGLMKRILPALGNLRLDRISPQHLLTFYTGLEEEGVRQDIAYTCTQALCLPCSKAAFSVRTGVGIAALDALLSGGNISLRNAHKVSDAFCRPFSQLFTPVSRGALSGKTALHYHRLLSSILGTAVLWQLLPSNPCARVKPPRVERHEAQYLDEKQATQLISLLDREPMQYRTMILLLINTGLRRGELCGLEWKDLDLEHGVLHVCRNTQYLPETGVYDDTPKTASARRSIKLPSGCIPMLKEYRLWQLQTRLQLCDQWQDCDRLFTRWNGARFHPDTLTGWFHSFVKRNELPPVTIHSLRHTNATLLLAAGTNLRTVSARLGHAQTSTTANIYTHALQSADAVAAETLNDILNPLAVKPARKRTRAVQ